MVLPPLWLGVLLIASSLCTDTGQRFLSIETEGAKFAQVLILALRVYSPSENRAELFEGRYTIPDSRAPSAKEKAEIKKGLGRLYRGLGGCERFSGEPLRKAVYTHVLSRLDSLNALAIEQVAGYEETLRHMNGLTVDELEIFLNSREELASALNGLSERERKSMARGLIESLQKFFMTQQGGPQCRPTSITRFYEEALPEVFGGNGHWARAMVGRTEFWVCLGLLLLVALEYILIWAVSEGRPRTRPSGHKGRK